MTTTPLQDYLITCDMQYPQVKCRQSVLIHGAPDQYNAEERATALRWRIGLLASCPACEEHFQSASETES